MKKLGRVEGRVYRKKVYKVTKGDDVFEGDTDEVVKYLDTSLHVFNSTKWRCTRRRKPFKLKGYTIEHTQNRTSERVYLVVNADGKEVSRGSLRKLALEYGYTLNSLKCYASNHKPMTIRRKKYYFVPTEEYDVVWKRVH